MRGGHGHGLGHEVYYCHGTGERWAGCWGDVGEAGDVGWVLGRCDAGVGSSVLMCAMEVRNWRNEGRANKLKSRRPPGGAVCLFSVFRVWKAGEAVICYFLEVFLLNIFQKTGFLETGFLISPLTKSRRVFFFFKFSFLSVS